MTDPARLLAEHPDVALDGPDALPLLVDFTEEDVAARGLRRAGGRTAPERPVYMTALEAVAMERALLLTAPPGGGKTAFARRLALAHARSLLGKGSRSLASLSRPVHRNEEGDIRPEGWTDAPLHPVSAPEEPSAQDRGLLIFEAGADARPVVERYLAMLEERPGWRLLVLARPLDADAWSPVPGLARRRLLPLLGVARRAACPGLPEAAYGPEAALPGLFALARQVSDQWSGASALVRTWHATLHPTPARRDAARSGCLAALETGAEAPDLMPSPVPLFLAAEALAAMPPQAAVTRIAAAPALCHALAATGAEAGAEGALAEALALHTGGLPGLLAAATGTPALAALPPVSRRLADALSRGLAPLERVRAASLIARAGDPRALETLAEIPGGTFRMGGALHPNSEPAHEVRLAPFRIGVHPVTNALYSRFVATTGRHWPSPTGRDPEASNMPATDVTWHDARAFCAWATADFRDRGRIAATDTVRLPTEAEWEFAARGSDARTWPWGDAWAGDRANSEELGLNAPCAVGLFPAGTSPFGCRDMAGQVWEWVSTLWGRDMGRPDFAYPWRPDDGRENADAPDDVRRVLRGGCFASPAQKANAVYRGSLEADGFWRGNGFRVVVATEAPA